MNTKLILIFNLVLKLSCVLGNILQRIRHMGDLEKKMVLQTGTKSIGRKMKTLCRLYILKFVPLVIFLTTVNHSSTGLI